MHLLEEIVSVKDSSGKEITDEKHIGLINPYRYRSYRYDSETGLYYLQSRYYNPEWGRFVNADNEEILLENQEHLIEHNLYSYCLNSPINMIDIEGDNAIAMIAAAAGIGLGAGAGILIGGILVIGGILIYYKIQKALRPAINKGLTYIGLQILNKTIAHQAKKTAKKTAKESGKERATDIPSWARGLKKKAGENGKTYAKRLMDWKYGKGKWKKSSKEYSQLKNGAIEDFKEARLKNNEDKFI